MSNDNYRFAYKSKAGEVGEVKFKSQQQSPSDIWKRAFIYAPVFAPDEVVLLEIIDWGV
jgi:hypothetical protein